MTAGLEIVAIETWLYDTLAGNAAGVANRVHSSIATREQTFPYIVYELQDATDVRGVGTAQIMSNCTYLIRAIDRGKSKSTIATIAQTINTLLHAADGANINGTVIGCVREQPFSLSEVADGVEYRYLGGIYRIFVQ